MKKAKRVGSAIIRKSLDFTFIAHDCNISENRSGPRFTTYNLYLNVKV